MKRCSKCPPTNVISGEGSSALPATPSSSHSQAPSASAEAAAPLLPRCLLPPSGLHLTMQEEETPATKRVKRKQDWGWGVLASESPKKQAPPPLHLSPMVGGGIPRCKTSRSSYPWDAEKPHGQLTPSPPSTRSFSQASPLHYGRTSPFPRERAPAPRWDKVASIPQGGAEVSYPLAPQGPLSGRE